MKVQLAGYIDVPANRLDAVTGALPEHIRLSRAEPGCESFDVTPGADGRFEVSEVFSNQTAFEQHQARVAASNWGEITAGLSRHYSVREIPG